MSFPVSALIPCRDENPDRIAETVESVLAANPAQVVLCDDGSKTPPIVPRDTRIKLVRQDATGIASAINRAAHASGQPWLAWCSIGDTWHKDKIRKQYDDIRSSIARASFHGYHSDNTDADTEARPDWSERIWSDNQFCGSTTMVERGLFEYVGGYDESLLYCVDWMFALRVQHARGWRQFAGIYATAGQHDGGHTSRASGESNMRRAETTEAVEACKRRHRRDEDRAKVATVALQMQRTALCA